MCSRTATNPHAWGNWPISRQPAGVCLLRIQTFTDRTAIVAKANSIGMQAKGIITAGTLEAHWQRSPDPQRHSQYCISFCVAILSTLSHGVQPSTAEHTV